jgi:hypothetical protein
MSAFSEAAVGAAAVPVADPFNFDSVLFLEESMYEAGIAEGALAAREEAFFLEEGRRGGFLRGYAIGIETGFMQRVVGVVGHTVHTAAEGAEGKTAQTAQITQGAVLGESQVTEGAPGTEGAPPAPAPSAGPASASASASAPVEAAEAGAGAGASTGAGTGAGAGAGAGAGVGKVSRGERRRAELLDRIRALPLHNAQTVDFPVEVAALRALYKQVCAASPQASAVGAFLPAAASAAAGAEVTQQW